jgi:hypothetical protein
MNPMRRRKFLSTATCGVGAEEALALGAIRAQALDAGLARQIADQLKSDMRRARVVVVPARRRRRRVCGWRRGRRVCGWRLA